jgi:PAS domain S-box-containing protein
MTELQQLDDEDDRYARWVSMWQEAVRTSHFAMGLAELSTARFVELSPRAAELLGTTVEVAIGLSYPALAEPSSAAAESFRLAREGIIDGTRTRRTLRRLDGSTVEVQATGWAVRSDAGPDLGLWMATEVPAGARAVVAEEVVAPWFPSQPRGELEGVRVAVDDRWSIAHVQSKVGSLLGRPMEELHESSLLDLIHPDDRPGLLFALARATTDTSARALVRVQHRDGSWHMIQVAPAVLEGDEVTPAAFVLTADEDREAPAPNRPVREIPAYLRRIADQIEAAGVLAPLAETADALGVATTDLSPREWEIVSRLLRGERVSTIAAEIYLSPKTVRNHLSAIFAKVGVHSQAELLALYLNETPTAGSSPR